MHQLLTVAVSHVLSVYRDPTVALLPAPLSPGTGPRAKQLWDFFISSGRLRVAHYWISSLFGGVGRYIERFHQSTSDVLDNWVLVNRLDDKDPGLQLPILQYSDEILDGLNPDLVILHTSRFLSAPDNLRRRPIICCEHSGAPTAALSKAARFSRRTVVVNEKFGDLADFVIPCSATPRCFQASPMADHPPPYRALYVGRFSSEKVPEPFLSALDKKARSDWLYVFMGDRGESYTALRQLAGKMENILLLPYGSPEEVARQMQLADVVFLPTDPKIDEGFGLVAAEAAACGRPIISTAPGLSGRAEIAGSYEELLDKIHELSDYRRRCNLLEKLRTPPAPRFRLDWLQAVRKALMPQVTVVTNAQRASDAWLNCAYEGLKAQTLRNWQWNVVLNPDSKFLSYDPRVFRLKSLQDGSIRADYILRLDPPALPMPKLLESQLLCARQLEPVKVHVCCRAMFSDGSVMQEMHGLAAGRICHQKAMGIPPIGGDLYLNREVLILIPRSGHVDT